jgi:prepilin-type N-terminal cleavage/methylation domain-containing protein
MLTKMRNFLKRNDATGKRRKGFTLVELMVAMSIVILLGAAAFFAYGHVQQMRKMAQVTTDMDAISAACLTYESLNKNGTLPATLDDLNTGLTAEQSIDGVAHTGFIQAGKTTTSGTNSTVSIKDPWDQDYGYSQKEIKLTCTPKDANGNSMAQITKTF